MITTLNCASQCALLWTLSGVVILASRSRTMVGVSLTAVLPAAVLAHTKRSHDAPKYPLSQAGLCSPRCCYCCIAAVTILSRPPATYWETRKGPFTSREAKTRRGSWNHSTRAFHDTGGPRISHRNLIISYVFPSLILDESGG